MVGGRAKTTTRSADSEHSNPKLIFLLTTKTGMRILPEPIAGRGFSPFMPDQPAKNRVVSEARWSSTATIRGPPPYPPSKTELVSNKKDRNQVWAPNSSFRGKLKNTTMKTSRVSIILTTNVLLVFSDQNSAQALDWCCCNSHCISFPEDTCDFEPEQCCGSCHETISACFGFCFESPSPAEDEEETNVGSMTAASGACGHTVANADPQPQSSSNDVTSIAWTVVLVALLLIPLTGAQHQRRARHDNTVK